MAKGKTKRKRTPIENARLDLKLQKERVEDLIDVYGDFAVRLREESKHLAGVLSEQRPLVVALLSVGDAVERLRNTIFALHYGERAEKKIRRLKKKAS